MPCSSGLSTSSAAAGSTSAAARARSRLSITPISCVVSLAFGRRSGWSTFLAHRLLVVLDDFGVDDLLLGLGGGAVAGAAVGRGRGLLLGGLVDLLGDLVEGPLQGVGLRLDLLDVV